MAAVNLLAHALAYAARGWSILPVKYVNGHKSGAVRWKRFQTFRATEEVLRRWFEKNPDWQIGVICGAVSGGLICRDFDAPGAYEAWAKAHGELAATLPTVRTGRGWHVYFRARDLRFRALADGEYRGEKHFVVLPPSRHPNGARYAWTVPLPEGELPMLSPIEAGLLPKEEPKPEPQADPEAQAPGADRPDRPDCPDPPKNLWPPTGLTQRTFRFCQIGAQDGHRNSELFAAACDMASKGIAPQEAEQRLLAGCRRCRPPYPEAEALPTIRSAYSKPRWQVRSREDPWGAYVLPRCIAKRKHLKDSAKLAWAALDYRQRDKADSFPGLNTLGADIGRSRDTAHEAVKALEREALLTVRRTRGQPNRYTTRLPKPGPVGIPYPKYHDRRGVGEKQQGAGKASEGREDSRAEGAQEKAEESAEKNCEKVILSDCNVSGRAVELGHGTEGPGHRGAVAAGDSGEPPDPLPDRQGKRRLAGEPVPVRPQEADPRADERGEGGQGARPGASGSGRKVNHGANLPSNVQQAADGQGPQGARRL